MNVLSLFDGMSCGQQALERIGIKVNNYFASEIDKYAITVTMANYPNTYQLGSIINVDGYSLPKIDLLIGGSPCQSFSFAGKRKGMSTKDEQEILTLEHYLQLKSEGYEFEGQSYLFWEYMRLLNEVKPKYFLLENVMMGEKWERVLSKSIGVNPIEINSSLVSAQNRRRLYWTNIGMKELGLFGDLESIIEQPKDKGILLRDVLESDVDEKYFLSENQYNKILYKTNVNSNVNEPKILDIYNKKIKEDGKSITLTDPCHNNLRLIEPYIKIDKEGKIKNSQNKSSCITAGGNSGGNHSDMDLIVHNTQQRNPNRPSVKENKNAGGSGHLSRNDGKTYCLDSQQSNAIEINNSRIRRLTPIECERLQTVKDNYTNYVSDTQRYRMLGNGWTVDVIAHIFKYMK
jgi:DNA (cytosine-5)-methyltransferase 3A